MAKPNRKKLWIIIAISVVAVVIVAAVIKKKTSSKFKCIIIKDCFKLTNKLGKRIFIELNESIQGEVLQLLSIDSVIKIIKRLESDNAIKILENLEKDTKEKVLDKLPHQINDFHFILIYILI